jgi:hypothetical protein
MTLASFQSRYAHCAAARIIRLLKSMQIDGPDWTTPEGSGIRAGHVGDEGGEVKRFRLRSL